MRREIEGEREIDRERGTERERVRREYESERTLYITHIQAYQHQNTHQRYDDPCGLPVVGYYLSNTTS